MDLRIETENKKKIRFVHVVEWSRSWKSFTQTLLLSWEWKQWTS